MIAQQVGKLLGFDMNNDVAKALRFCVALEVGEGWIDPFPVATLLPEGQVKVIIDYENLPIRYTFCLNLTHGVKNCPELLNQKWGLRSRHLHI